MKRRQWLGLVGWLAALWVPSSWAGTEPADSIAVANAEDLALVADGRWVIASSMPAVMGEPGGLYGIATDARTVTALAPDREAVDSRSWAGCDGPLPPDSFSPHGIAVQNVEGRELLFVVSHGEREAVEIYEIRSEGALSLYWLDCLELPSGASANAVAGTADGRVFVTNMNAPDEPGSPDEAAHWMGNVLEWSVGSGWVPLPGSRLYAPNGLLVSDDGATVWVASWAGGEVVRWIEGQQTALPLPFLPDNLRWESRNTLLAAGLRGSPPEVVACLMGQGDCTAIGTAVARVDVASGDLRLDCVRELSLSMGTVALPVASDWWVGPVRGEQVRIVEGDSPACRR